MNTKSVLTMERARRSKKWRFNPLNGLDAERLGRYLDAFDAGYLRDAANAWEQIEMRDDLLRTVISKRKKSVARNGWTVLPVPNLSPEQKEEARAHAEALQFFYSHLQCEHAVDQNERGGFKLLARQMMDAVGKRFAVHEIVWRNVARASSPAGSAGVPPTVPRKLTATFRFVPLSFFENTTGQLRFLENESLLEGRSLDPGAWMVTTGEGLMFASSIGWMFKNMSLNDWLLFCERNGRPGLRGISASPRDSDEWNAMQTALDDILNGRAVVHGSGDDIKVIDLAPGGNVPFPALIERVDRLNAALWRGADLSTLSRDRGYGASLQDKETCALEEDDAEMLTETLNRYVDEWVIKYLFGQSAQPLARVKVLTTPKECTTYDLQVDEFLLSHGAPLSIEETLNRYGRTLPKSGEPTFQISRRRRQESLISSPPAAYQNESAEAVQIRLANKQEDHRQEAENSKSSPQPLRLCGEKVESGLANSFTLLQPDWVQLSPYGDFPHPRGLQRVDRSAAETMVRNFNSFLGKLGRLFGGAPFYVGHPDMPETSDTADRKAYGWINQLEAREDGLYARVKWSDPGLELLRNGHFKFLSPYWEAEEIGRDNNGAIYRPVLLLSVGLTNQPNLPVKPLANQEDTTTIPEGSNPAANATRVPEIAASASSSSLCAPRLRGENERQIACALENAFAHGRITPAQEEFWRVRLEHDFANASVDLTRLSPVMHIVSCTQGLGLRKGETQRMQNRRDRIQECVLSKMRLGLNYDQAWESVKREHPQWFDAMRRPEQ